MVGLHLRVYDTFSNLARKAMRLKIPFFQCFMLNEQGRYMPANHEDRATFVDLRRQNFQQLYVHGSYWINLCSPLHTAERVLRKELKLAKRLEFTHFILHSGSARRCNERTDGIKNLAQALNCVLKREDEIVIVLENTAHGNLSVGSDFHDFKMLNELLDYPERIQFCLDTAHAYSFGYDISTESGQADFISLIDETMGLDRIALLHLNDTPEVCGCQIDRHGIIGEDGNIGIKALECFAAHDQLYTVPIILELPELSEEKEEEILNIVRSWRAKGI